MSSCKKCRAGPMSVHILSNGFCQACTNELSWKQGERVAREQMAKRQRVAMFKQGEKIIKKKWKEKYGDASVDEVLGY
jgi:hypothetical protein|tara:strand:- start:137 stop:370 length:234 start_codon:yes stop_codon:yes gene_type:complete